MFKCIALLRRRPDLSREAFIDYYERQHAPLIRRLLPGIVDYRRNYVELEGAFLFPGAAPIDFDVITEIWLTDRAAYDRFTAAATQEDIARQIAEDEENFLDRPATRMMVVEERASDAPSAVTPQSLLDERDIVRGRPTSRASSTPSSGTASAMCSPTISASITARAAISMAWPHSPPTCAASSIAAAARNI